MRPSLTALALLLACSASASSTAAANQRFFVNGAFSERPESLAPVLTVYAIVKAEPQPAIVFQDGPQAWGNQLTVLMAAMGSGHLDKPTACYALELAMWAATAEASDDPVEAEAALLNQRMPETITWAQFRDLQTLRRAWTAAVP